MDNTQRIEAALDAALAAQEGPNGPPKLAAAIRHSVFPGGARIRPHLTLAVAQACGADDLSIAAAAGAAIELMHCASLVHDDLPCFDNAATRRGRPSVFAAYGERLAVLAGDALIVAAYQSLAAVASAKPERLGPLFATLSAGVAAPSGIVAGQAWEC
ncbi:MAG: polyprenyl synthetase family protein, partial [Oxalobacteraceae bacterium]|nr:polyprenyl synthetase family protein [Oxalobacteraceae bacterium]